MSNSVMVRALREAPAPAFLYVAILKTEDGDVSVLGVSPCEKTVLKLAEQVMSEEMAELGYDEESIKADLPKMVSIDGRVEIMTQRVDYIKAIP